MKRVVSVSLGSSARDHATEIELLGQPLRLERVGVDGDLGRYRRTFLELDGQVDAFGVGGADLGITVDGRHHPLHSVLRLVRGVQTPLVDGEGVRRVVERRIVQRLERRLTLPEPRRVLIGSAAARWDMALSFRDAGYEGIYGDLAFGLGVPVALRSLDAVRRFSSVLMPVVGRLPFRWIYPVGPDQDRIVPRYGAWYDEATVLADDWHYLKKHLPDRLDGKVVVTNTTTAADVRLLRERGAAWLCTVTPRLGGRSFGTNVIEAALVAVAGAGRPLTPDEIEALGALEDLEPAILDLRGGDALP